MFFCGRDDWGLMSGMATDSFDLARTVKVLNISSRATERLFNIFFEPCGKLTKLEVHIPSDETEEWAGWALVEFDTTTAACTALRFSGCASILASVCSLSPANWQQYTPVPFSSDFLRHKVTIEPYYGPTKAAEEVRAMHVCHAKRMRCMFDTDAPCYSVA
jgi:hypothetical protein